MSRHLPLRSYRRKRRFGATLWRWGDHLALRALARGAACLFLFGTIALGLVEGRHLDVNANPQKTVLGRIAPIFGYSAQTIRIAGLRRQNPDKVLAALGVEAGSPLVGFNAETAGKLLENIDWIEQAKVRRVFPNILEIDIVEREPFAIWQNGGRYYVIDRTGAAMSFDAVQFAKELPLVTGAGAQKAVYQLFTQLESHSALRAKLKAAARVGERRWTLYFANQVRVALPEEGVEQALSWIEDMDLRHGVLSKGILSIDLRMAEQAIIIPQIAKDEAEGESVKVSHN
ncbi:MAG TPA: cell division protein FtsQ/DivIB [Aestuariivirgaceae bacterium]|jgi:cell division protein FtsQ